MIGSLEDLLWISIACLGRSPIFPCFSIIQLKSTWFFLYRNWPSLTYQSMWHLNKTSTAAAGSTWIMKPIGRSQGSGIFLINKLAQTQQWKPRQAQQSAKEKMAETCGSLLGKSMNIDDSVHLLYIVNNILFDDFRILLEVLGSENQTQSCVMTIMIRKHNKSTEHQHLSSDACYTRAIEDKEYVYH